MGIYNYTKLLILSAVAVCLFGAGLFFPVKVSADAIGEMKALMTDSGTEDSSKDVENGTDEAGDKEDKKTTCGPEAVKPVDVCELGQGLLCLNSPPFSVDGKHVIVHGTVDKRTSVFSHLKVYVQHDYTKGFNEVETKEWASSGCWEDGWTSDYNGCIDSKGYFGVKVPLSQLGPYTIMIDAVSVDGKAVSETVKTSRVVAPKISRKDIVIDPDPSESGGLIEASKVILTVDLLHDCKNCDFIGTSTGGVMVTVNNAIDSTEGGVKSVVRRGNIAAAGRLDICVPVLSGKNNLTVTVCNAATKENCPKVEGISFDVKAGATGINLKLPDDRKIVFDAADYSTIPLKFSVGSGLYEGGECREGDVVVSWNRHKPVSLCPSSDGFYYARLIPEIGINVGTIEAAAGGIGETRSFVLGWGKLVNPYSGSDSGWVDGGLGLKIGSGFINETIRPLINNFINSENLPQLMDEILSNGSGKSGKHGNEEEQKRIAAIVNEIPHCKAASGLGAVKMKLVEKPSLKRGELERLTFDSSGVGFELDLEGFNVRLQAFRDENGDNRPDGSIIPLLISFRGAQVDGKLKIMPDGKPLFLITSDHTDCDYINGSYCKKKPALLVPANIVGGATKGGSFVRCDDKGQQIDKETERACRDINKVNSQTAALSQKVLDTINDLIYCRGSAMLTYYMREKLKDVRMSQALPGRQIYMGMGADPAGSRIEISKNGLGTLIPARFGGDGMIADLDPRIQTSGIFTDPARPSMKIGAVDADSVSIALSTELINELLYQLTFQKPGSGILDWELDEVFFNKRGFDFVTECDAFDPIETGVETPPALCQLRPRVGELLGTALVNNGYFTVKHPLRMTLTGSRKIAPHIKIYQADVPYELPPVPGEEEARYEYRPADVAELQIPDLEMASYALEVDELAGKDDYGNLAILLGNDGRPVVRSMIEGSAQPVPIIRANVTLLLAVEVGNFTTSAEDASKLLLTVRPIPEFTKVVFRKISGGNATMVSDDSLLSAFREKLNYGIEIYGDPKKPLTIEIPKGISEDISFESFFDRFEDLFSMLGLEKLSFGNDGLALELDHAAGRIHFTMKPELE